MQRISTKSKSDIGVVLCDCGGTLTARLDFKALRSALAAQAGVAAVKQCSGFCRAAEAARVMRALAARHCRRVVVAACRQDIYAKPLAAAMSKTRIRPGMTADAMIREQCAWVHANRAQASAKALDLISAAVRRAGCLAPLVAIKKKINTNVVILGGGMAGMHVALGLADLGHAVTLVTRDDELGGCARRCPEFFSYLDDDAAAAAARLQQALAAARERITSNRHIRWISKAACLALSGEIGRFSVGIRVGEREQTLKAGALVLAVGSFAEFPHSQGTGSKRILNLADLADALRADRSVPRKIAIIVDMQGEQGRAVHALVLAAAERLAASARRRVVVYCRHVRVAAWGMESLYRRVRSVGTIFCRYETPPKITEDEDGILVHARDIQSGMTVEERFDAVVMADARPADYGGLPLPRTLRRGPAGALQADNVWLLSSQTNQPGIHVIGAARGNSELRDAMNDAGAAAEAIHQVLGSGTMTVNADAPVVDAEKCVLCLTCLRSCPHGAIVVDNKKDAVSVSVVACQRCGLCATLCPARAIEFPRASDDQVFAELTPGPGLTVFACENSAWPAANAAGTQRREYGAGVRLIRVPCAGRVDERHVLGALEHGADRVLILGCHAENCRYLVGADHAVKRVARLQAMLAKAGLDPARVAVGTLTEFETGRFLNFVKA